MEVEDFQPWQWILEHLIGVKDAGSSILKEMMTYIPDIKYYGNLQKRVALRYLEDAVVAGKINEEVIPLVETVFRSSTPEAHENSMHLSASSYKDLFLRVKIEAVLTHIRGKPKDWQGFSKALNHVFPEKSTNLDFLGKREELTGLLQIQDQEMNCAKLLESYSLSSLCKDLLQLVNSEKCNLGDTFLIQLLHDVFEGKYPFPECLVAEHVHTNVDLQAGLQKSRDGERTNLKMKPSDKNLVHKNHRRSDAGQRGLSSSDDIVHNAEKRGAGGKPKNGSNDAEQSSEKGSALPETNKYSCDNIVDNSSKKDAKLQPDHHKSDRGSTINLRQRNQYGKAITSNSPLKSTNGCISNFPPGDTFEGELAVVGLGFGDGMFKFEFSQVRPDGHEEYCHVCRQQGKLLFCTGCPLAVHIKCLGSDFSNLEERAWCCPVCVQKKAAEVVAKAKEEEKLARLKLAHFMASMEAGKPDENLRESPSAPINESKRESRKRKSAEHKLSVAEIANKSSFQADPKTGLEKGFEMHQTDKPMDTTAKSSKAGVEGPSHTDINIVSPNENHEEQAQLHEDDGDGHDGDLEEDSDGGNFHPKRFWRKQKHASRENRIIPGLRRKRLLWSKEEEEVLKEGVKKFSRDNGGWGFQWTRILDYGQGKFHPSRTDMDLKDKWRNLSKAVKPS